MGASFSYSELAERRLRASVDYNLYFESDTFEGLRLLQMEIGRIHLPTGQILACDPVDVLSSGEEVCRPLEHAVEPGDYPVTLSVVKGNTPASGDQYAAVRIKFSENRPVKWLLALRGNENLAELSQDGDYFGFSVGEGFGCLVDKQGHASYRRLCDTLKQNKKDLIEEYINPQLKKSYEQFPHNQRENGDWFNALIPGENEVNLILFQTGFGDGIYPCYWGLDEEGSAVQLVIDFFVLRDSVPVSAKAVG